MSAAASTDRAAALASLLGRLDSWMGASGYGTDHPWRTSIAQGLAGQPAPSIAEGAPADALTATAVRAALADACGVLLDSCTASGALQSVLAALEPVRHRLEKEAPLLDAARLLVDGLWFDLGGAHEAARDVLQADGGPA